jgi:hypothetical protein
MNWDTKLSYNSEITYGVYYEIGKVEFTAIDGNIRVVSINDLLYCQSCGIRNGETVNNYQSRSLMVAAAEVTCRGVVHNVKMSVEGTLCQCCAYNWHNFDQFTGLPEAQEYEPEIKRFMI